MEKFRAFLLIGKANLKQFENNELKNARDAAARSIDAFDTERNRSYAYK